MSVYRRMSPLASKKGPLLTAPVPSDDGRRKPARPYVRKDTLLLRRMLSWRHVESRQGWISTEINNIEQVFVFWNRGDELYDGSKVIDRRLETEHTYLYNTEDRKVKTNYFSSWSWCEFYFFVLPVVVMMHQTLSHPTIILQRVGMTKVTDLRRHTAVVCRGVSWHVLRLYARRLQIDQRYTRGRNIIDTFKTTNRICTNLGKRKKNLSSLTWCQNM